MPQKEIVCKRCKKKATINAKNGVLCKSCWMVLRKERRQKKQQDSLNHCLSFTREKVTEREAEIIDEIMREMNKDGKKEVNLVR
jgi:hypothetical protein